MLLCLSMSTNTVCPRKAGGGANLSQAGRLRAARFCKPGATDLKLFAGAQGRVGPDALRAYGPELSPEAQVDAWGRYHALRLAVWDELGALVERGAITVTSALADRRWSAMYRNAGMEHWIGQLTPAGRAVAETCLGVLEFVQVWQGGPPVGVGRVTTGAMVRADGVVAALGLSSYGAMLGARDRYFRSVARLAHEWVWQRASLHADIMDSHQDAILETLAAVETYWPALGKFSTWLYSRLLGLYTNRLRHIRRTPAPTLALTMQDVRRENWHDEGVHPGVNEAALYGAAAGAENPWPAGELELDAQRVVARATAELDGAPVVLELCRDHRAALVKGRWRKREYVRMEGGKRILEPRPLTCACALCHTGAEARERVAALVAAGLLDGDKV